MKHLIFASLISLLSTSAFALGQHGGDPCKCPSGTCPGYKEANCAFTNARDKNNQKVKNAPSNKTSPNQIPQKVKQT
jgi:hypothetical protein